VSAVGPGLRAGRVTQFQVGVDGFPHVILGVPAQPAMVPAGNVLRVGLSLLSALTKLCMNGSASILDRSPEQGAA